ncbi:MAG TPA: PP2C family serine/threonine-protein phosphatase [Pyrinomonadaceae bacterium]|jgi:protein phosphatase
MSAQTSEVVLETAAVSDRGLNEKRPLNEDSYLLDAERRVFAVADGVGGAEAGEVASQTAVEVLAEAFRYHKPGDDVEDLMELAIQRANAAIYQMAHEERRFAMMATTIVALHLDGRRATFGHVGDSRLYRVAPDGRIFRETEDHSVVEEEVRAGRMTAEQAANHPSRNVISRALGAEASVEVDLKTAEVEDGTIFLLCSDGITRHVPDAELSAVLTGADTLEAACAELKRRCYERGAEDNLTAVLVRVGPRPAPPAATDSDEAPTLQRERTRRAAEQDASGAAEASASGAAASAPSLLQRPFAGAGAPAGSRVVVPAPQPGEPARAQADDGAHTATVTSPTGRAGHWFFVLLLVAAAAAAAFYGGIRYQRVRAYTDASTPAATASASPAESAEARFERLRREVDGAPAQAAQRYGEELGRQDPQAADAETLYLYGRALLLSGRQQDALRVFEQTIRQLDARAAVGRDPLRVEARIATAAAALKSNDPAAAQKAAQALDEVIEQQTAAGGDATPAPPQ